MLSKTRKLTRRELQQVLRTGVQFKNLHFQIKVLHNHLTFSRFAVVISTKVYPHSHDRNRLRRAIYSFFPNSLGENLDVVMSVFPSVVNLRDEVLSSEVNQVLSNFSFKS